VVPRALGLEVGAARSVARTMAIVVVVAFAVAGVALLGNVPL
jgi:hypothetical protein